MWGGEDEGVKGGGYRIELGEIEAVLAEHEAVRQSVVVVREEGAGDVRVEAFVVSEQGKSVSKQIRSYLQERVPDYMVPSRVVVLDALPLLSNGKVDRRALLSLAAYNAEPDLASAATHTPIEELLAKIWCEVLGDEQVGIHDDFFGLGGHSLLATQIISRVRAVLQVELPVQTLFESPTIAKLAQRVEQALRGGQQGAAPPLVAVTRTQELPLSLVQERLWFLDQLEPGSIAYLMPGAYRLDGVLDTVALELSIGELIRRHERVRTIFPERAGQPVQFVHPAGVFRLMLVDLGQLSAEERGNEARRLARQEAQQPFDLARGSLLRVSLLRLDSEEHVLLVTMHHIICDGWSSDIVVRELMLLHRAFAAREPSPLAPLSIQYADFAAWQRQWLQGDVLETQLTYWRRQLAGAPPLELPADHPRPPLQTYRGASLLAGLPAPLSQGLLALSQQEDVTLFMLLLAAFQGLLARHTGQTDISVGTVIDNHTHSEREGLSGSLMNTLVLRTNLSGNPTFVEVLRLVRKVTLEAYTHQDVPFEHLVEVLQPERDLSRSPLFQVVFNVVQQVPMGAEELSGLSISNLDIEHCATRFDLSLSVRDSAFGLDCLVVYSADLFEASSISRLLEHWQTLLEGIVSSPQTALSELPILTSRERQLILRDWNANGIDVSRGLRIQDLFEAQVERMPEGIAVVYEDQQLTYNALSQLANQLAHYLQELGVGPEVLVGICMERSVELTVGLWSILKAGGAYVPLDPSYPKERLAFILEDAQAVVLLTQRHIVDTLPAHNSQVVCLDADRAAISRKSREPLHGDVRTNHLAYMIYTSGSTGMPKGVMIAHANLVNAYYSWEHAYRLRSVCTVHLQMANFSFDVFTGDMVRALCSGGKLVLCPRELLLEAKQLYALMRQEQVDSAEFVPVVLRNLLNYLQESAQSLDFMRVLVVGSDSWYGREHQGVGLLCGQQTRLINSYGVTEATVDSSYFEGMLRGGAAEGIVPIGRPFANIEIYLLDKYLQPVPVGSVGELHIGGKGLARGYRNRPELTAEKFIPHLWSDVPGARLYKTGDLAQYQPDGTILYVGRLDDQVKVRGYRIELGEIEAVLAEHPWVREGVLLASENSAGDKRLVAYVVGTPVEARPSDHELRRYLQERLPDYMVPACFVSLEVLPLTPNGKVDRRALPVPGVQQEERDDEQAAPRTPLEELLAEIWCEVLIRSQIGVHDNFFALGGHSLLATRLISQVRTVLQVDVPLRSLFENPTVAGLALRVEQALRDKQMIEAPPLIPVPRTQDLPLSFAQQRLWFFDQLEPESIAYLMPSSLRLHGPLDTVALERSLEALMRRHESLRTTFHERAGQPVQVIHPACVFYLPLVDLRELEQEARACEARRLAGQEVQRPFNLTQWPLLRVSLLRLDTQEHVLLVTMHHIISDGWSDVVFMREMTTLYQAFVAGQPSPLPPLPIQYADFAVWQRQWLQGEVLEAQLVYWQRQLADIPQLELPTDHPRPAIQTYRGAHQGMHLPETLHQGLINLSQREGVTLFMLLLAAFQALLARYTGQNDISIGTLIANRTRTELEGLIGYFVNTLVLRTNLSGNPSFVEIVSRVRETALGAYAHQDVPFEQLVDMLQAERDLSRSPLFQVMFSLRQISGQVSTTVGTERQRPQELSLNGLGIEHPKAVFDLTFAAVSSMQGLNCQVEYSTDLFEAGTIRRLLGHWQTLLQAIVSAPQTPLTRLPLLSDAERRHLLVDWNATQTPVPAELSLHMLFAQQAVRMPDAVAVKCGEAILTYGDLNRRANQLARYLLALGVGPDVLVGIYMERSAEMLVTMLATFKAGGAYLPLDPAYPAQHLTYMLQDAQVQVMVTQAQWVGTIPISIPSLICLEQSWHVIAGYGEEPPLTCHHEHQLAYVIYTSGSTGRPKGAMVTHRGMLNHLLAKIETLQLGAHDRVAQTASHCFDISIWQFLSVLLQGGQVHIMVDQVSHDPLSLFKQVAAEYISILEIVPSLLRACLDSIEQRQLPVESEPIKSLRWLVVTGEAFPTDLCRQWAQRYAHVLQLNAYGPTECSDDVTHAVIAPARLNGRASVPIGQPIANTQIYILDSHFEPVPIGVPGQIYVGGSGVGRGYLRNAERTAMAFVPDPFSQRADARLYTTGDIGRYLENGHIEFLGRIDQQVKVRGYRIELGEIEAALLEHPSVSESVVLAHEDGKGNKRLVAYIVDKGPATGTSSLVAYIVDKGPATGTSTGELRRYLQEKLPEYMVPASLVTLKSLPLTPNGKVDREALVAPETSRSESSIAAIAVRTPIEEIIAEIWCEVLSCSQVDLHDNFFELGGHSLLATQLISRVRAVLQVEVPLRSLFSAPTIAGLAQRVEHALRGGQGVEAPPLVPVARTRDLPLSFAQQRLWFLDQLESESTAYLIPGARRFYGDVNTVALERSLEALVRRHEILRTTFQVQAGQPVQVIHPAEVFRLPVVDLRGLKQEERTHEAQQLVRQEAQRPCDLGRGPLLRTNLLRLEVEEHVLLVTMHHIISDGWSNDVFMRELMMLYGAFAAGQPSPLPPLPIQYADFAVWQRNWLQGEVLQKHLDYWKRQLAGASPLDLPTDHPRPIVQSYRGADYSFALSADLSARLVALSKQEGVTSFMTLLAAFQTLLYRSTGQTNIVVGTDVANRTHVETEALIGFFINLLALRIDLSGSPIFRNVLHRVREMVIGAYMHQELPFEMLVEHLRLERRTNQMPLVQVLFVLQNTPRPSGKLPGVIFEAANNGETTSKFDLALFMQEAAHGIGGVVTYSTDLFEERTIATLISRFEALLHSIVANPATSVDMFDIYTDAEKAGQLKEKQGRRKFTARNLKAVKGKEIDVL